MQHVFAALMPVFSLILIGYFFKRIKFPSNDFWANADKLTYFILMPSLLVYKISTANLESLDTFDFIIVALLGIFAILFISIIIDFRTSTSGPSFTSIVQGSIRYNIYVFLALIATIFADEGLALAAFLMTLITPIINVLCICIFAIYANNQKISLLGIIKSIVKNPLIISCIIGGALKFFDINTPIVISNILKILSASALPMGLLSVGFSLDLNSIKEAKFELILPLFLKLIIMPIIIYFLAKVFHLNSLLTSIVVVFASMPTAVTSFVLARQLGGDTKLMAAIVTLQIILSFFSIALILFFLVS